MSGQMVLNMISKNVGIIANSNWEYQKLDFLILGNWVSNWDSSGVMPKLGFQLGPIKSDGISLKKLTRKSAKMPNLKILQSVPGTLHKILGIRKFGQKILSKMRERVHHKFQDPHFSHVTASQKSGITILAMHLQF